MRCDGMGWSVLGPKGKDEKEKKVLKCRCESLRKREEENWRIDEMRMVE